MATFQSEVVVRSVIFNAASYYILDVAPQGGVPFTAKGNLFGLDRITPGVALSVKGVWGRNGRYGKQLQIQSWGFPSSTSEYSLKDLMTVGLGFDPEVAKALMTSFGKKVFEKLRDPEALAKAFPEKSPELQACVLKFERSLSIQALSRVLRDGGLSSSDIEACVVRFGMNAPSLLKDNPYRLMEIPGFAFEKADALAFRFGYDTSNPQRLEGAVLWALNEASRNGHLYLKRGDIPQLAREVERKVPALPGGDFSSAFSELEARGAIVVDKKSGVYSKEFYEYERGSAEILSEMLRPSALQVDLGPFLEEFERSAQLELSEAQQEAVRQLVDHKVLTLTGLPGTGKTTAVRAIVRLFEVSRATFALMAPTGIAAKRLSHVTGHPASTIHRALGYDGVAWKHGPDNKFVVDAVIVDEVSMVDQELFYRLVSALRPDTMLVLVGDDAQLPSVGPGNVLKELVACPSVPSVRLTRIFRQAAQGDIVLNSHRINKGEEPDFGDPKGGSEFCLVRVSSEEKIRDYIVRMAKKLKDRNSNFQVLAPKYDGPVGVNSLNVHLRDVLNPSGPPEWSGRTQNFRVGDRVMVVKNNYKKGVYNGDVGKLLHAGKSQLIVRIYGVGNDTDLEVAFTEAEAEDYLRLAYAITVHKSQGSEFDTIIMPVVHSQGRMLQRNLLYTAVTRAKKKVWLLGAESAVQQAIENNRVQKRNTALGAAVSGVLEGKASV